MARKSRRSSMRDRVRKNSAEAPKRGQGGSLNLPDGVEWFEEKKRIKIDILPYEVSVPNHPDGVEPGELWYKMPYKIHFNIGSDNSAFVCPGTFRKKCPICEYRAQLARKADADEDILAALKPKDRVLYNVISRQRDDDPDIRVWDISYYNFQEMLDEEIAEGDEENAAFPDLEGGKTLRVRFSQETFKKGKFFRASRIDFDDRDDYDESILDEVVPLDAELNVLPYKELEKRFLELDEGDEDEQEEEKTTSRGRNRRRRGKQEDKETKEAEGGQEKDTSGDEEDPEPSRSRRRGRGRSRNGKDEEKGKEKESKNKCPAGFQFGEDFDDHVECDDCDVWKECMKEAEQG